MKRNELRVGSLVEVGALLLPHGIGEVCEINADSVTVKINGEFHYYLLEDLKPIPITEELLLRFGFEFTDNGAYHFKYESDKVIEIWPDEFNVRLWNGEIGWRMNFSSLWNPVKYAHQLQNLIHALTGTELELK